MLTVFYHVRIGWRSFPVWFNCHQVQHFLIQPPWFTSGHWNHCIYMIRWETVTCLILVIQPPIVHCILMSLSQSKCQPLYFSLLKLCLDCLTPRSLWDFYTSWCNIFPISFHSKMGKTMKSHLIPQWGFLYLSFHYYMIWQITVNSRGHVYSSTIMDKDLGLFWKWKELDTNYQ